MSTLVFQATLGGQINVVGADTASTFTVTVPAFTGTLASLATVVNNGVAYVNSSGQPTSGSTLTFDATTFTSGAHTLSTGNLNFSSTAQRITGDFSNATIANRVLFQTTTTNGATGVIAIPNGTGVASAWRLYNSSDTLNASIGDTSISNTTFSVRSFNTGTGTYLPITFETGGSEKVRIDTSGNVGIGATANASAILDAQSTTKGVRMPNMTTTEKNAISSPAAGLIVFDTTLSKLAVYSGAAWQTVTSV